MRTQAKASTLFSATNINPRNQLYASEGIHAKSHVSLAALILGMGIAISPIVSQAEVLDVKTGAWETTTTTKIEGMMMPKDILDQMPPERRAMVEQQLRARSGKSKTTKTHSCLTKKDLDRSQLLKSEDPKCTRKVLSNSSRKLEVEETCPPPEARKSYSKFEVKSPERFTGTVEVVLQEGGKAHMEMSGHWLSSVCKKGIDD